MPYTVTDNSIIIPLSSIRSITKHTTNHHGEVVESLEIEIVEHEKQAVEQTSIDPITEQPIVNVILA